MSGEHRTMASQSVNMWAAIAVVALTICQSGVIGSVIPDINDFDILRNATRETRSTIAAIVGGDYAKVGQFPWMVVVHRLLGGGRISMCGGTVLSKRWVLTAGHCVADSPRKFYVVFGEIDKENIGYDFYQGSGTAMTTTKGALHPEYSKTVNDIALLYMPKDIPLGGAIQPIKLAGAAEDSQTFAGRSATAVGWGKDGSASSGSQKLKYGQVPVISNSECSNTWNAVKSVICTKAGTGIDACQGDSGGPLVVRSNGEWLQIGVVSYGDADCPSSRPGVFTRVSSFSKWIKEVTGIEY